MDPAALVTALRQDGDALVAAAEAGPAAEVPTCPGWDVPALVRHVGGVHRWAAEIVRRGEPVRRRDLPTPEIGTPTRELAGWYRDGLDDLCATLEAADPEAPAWNFGGSGDQRVGWWMRRMVGETAVHRWDAQHAVEPSGPEPIGAAVAAQGINEYFHEFLAGVLAGSGLELTGTLHLHATGPGEVGGEWIVDFDASPPTVRRGHAKADTAIRGPVSDLLLWLYNRLAVGGARLEVFGSPDPVTAWPRLTL